MKTFSMAITCSFLFGAPTLSAQPEKPAVIAKHQLSDCMARRMSADRGLSYNDAMRACKERLQPPKDLASLGTVETGLKGH